eukprot:747531-Rhodomonas_salina.1
MAMGMGFDAMCKGIMMVTVAVRRQQWRKRRCRRQCAIGRARHEEGAGGGKGQGERRRTTKGVPRHSYFCQVVSVNSTHANWMRSVPVVVTLRCLKIQGP